MTKHLEQELEYSKTQKNKWREMYFEAIKEVEVREKTILKLKRKLHKIYQVSGSAIGKGAS